MKLRVTTFVSTILLLGASSVAIAQDAPTGEDAATVLKGRPYSPNADRGFPDKVLFGDTHVHSALSADAGVAARPPLDQIRE